MTTVTVTTEIPPRDKMEDNSALYESTSAHIIEETEYVKKIRTTLQKIRTQMFKDEIRHDSTNHKLDAKFGFAYEKDKRKRPTALRNEQRE